MKMFLRFFLIFSIICISLFIGNCGGTENTVRETEAADDETYIITNDGVRVNPSSSYIDTEYDTYLLVPGQKEILHLGGLYNSNYGANTWINCSGIWDESENPNITIMSRNSFMVGPSEYYSLPMELDVPSGASGEWAAKLNIGTIGQDTNYKPTYQINDYKLITLKVLPWAASARNFPFFVYQQQSQRCFGQIKNGIDSAFNEMGVTIIPDTTSLPSGSTSIIPDQIVNIDWTKSDFLYSHDLLLYAYRKLYPNLSIGDAADKLVRDYHNSGGKGALFIINNYNTIGGKHDDSWGITNSELFIQPTIFDGEYIMPSIAFVFAGKIKNRYNSTWEFKAIAAVAAHELGHLWCYGYTDTSHTYWHNGNNSSLCLMTKSFEIDTIHGTPGAAGSMTEKIFNKMSFCEGHQQRARNISWSNFIYQPVGQTTPIVNNIIASNNSSPTINLNVQSVHPDLEICLESKEDAIIQGQLWGCYVNIKNKGREKVSIPMRDFSINIYHQEMNKNFNYNFYLSSNIIDIEPSEEIVYPLYPINSIGYNEKSNFIPGTPWFYWYSGNYQINFSYNKSETIQSNIINLRIIDVPDSLKELFEGLKYSSNTALQGQSLLSGLENNAKKYQGTFFEKEYYFQLLTTYEYYCEALQGLSISPELINKAQQRAKYFILKYPDQPASFDLYERLIPFEGNNAILREIKDSLSNNKYDNSKLLYLIKKQMSKSIKGLQ